MFKVVLSKSAAKELYSLPVHIINRIVPVLKGFVDNPRPNGCKKLRGFQNLWRVRASDYRIVDAIDDNLLIVDIRDIGHRKEVYD